MKKVIILGAGPSGYGAAHKLSNENIDFEVFEKQNYIGGHCASFKFDGGYIFDDGPHISFTKDERIKKIFGANTGEQYFEFKAEVNNYWKGQWIKHPAQTNLFGVPPELNTQILKEMIEINHSKEEPAINNYEDWLYASFGKTFADNFPMKYTRKFHTTEARNLTTDWLGPRIYKPKLDEVIYGMLSPRTADVHYIEGFRYPKFGGFVTFLNGINESAKVNLNTQLTSINLKNKELTFNNKDIVEFEKVVSSLPLPKLISFMEDAPKEIDEAGKRLAWTQCLLVNLGVKKDHITDYHWSYVYDEDIISTRLSFPHLFSENLVPKGHSSIQVEVYFSDKYKPMTNSPEAYIDVVHQEMIKIGLLNAEDEITIKKAWVSPFAQIIFDQDRKEAVDLIHNFLLENGIHYCGRYGEWAYTWSDESFKSGENAADKILELIQ